MASLQAIPVGSMLRLAGPSSRPTQLVLSRPSGLRALRLAAPSPATYAVSHTQIWPRSAVLPPAQAQAGGPGGGSGAGSGGSGGGGGGSGDASHPMRPWTFLLAVLLAVGGAMGYIKKGSTQSLGGGVSGALILALAARSMTGPSMLSGARVAFGVTLMLGVFFLSRYARSKKVFPAGVGAGLSLGYAAAYVATGL